ncbi:MAG TPA: hypothetical protein VMF11_02770 [Candidatus Baltobacteraceae bacterium]|nr:hypothetical protein [Candidatus Baltobacteraceae bacterium]
MTEKAFRLDFFIALAALLVSALTAATLVYQTHVIGQQYAATIWPYISSDSGMSPTGLSLRVVNDGLGPALVQSAQLIVDGKNVPGWGDFFHALLRDQKTRAYFEQKTADVLAGKPFTGSIATSSLGPGTTIRPGDSMTLIRMELPGAPIDTMKRHTIGLKLCYCSLNKSCWILDTTVIKTPQETRPVATCPNPTSIAAQPFMSPSAPPRKKSL